MDFGGLVVVQCGRVPAVGRTAELPADSSSTAAEKRDVEGSKGVYVARAAVRAAWDAARSVFLVVLGSIVTGPRVGAPRKQRRAQAVVNRGGRVVVRARTIRAPMQGWGC